VCLLSDSDSEDKFIHPALDDDDQAPGDDSHWACPGQGALPPLAPAPAPRRQADMRKTMQAAGGPNIENVVRGIDADMGPNPDPFPSKRCGGQSRRASLKRKASHFTRTVTRSTAETFAYLTSKTKSVEEAADVFESFGNVSLCVKCKSLFFAYFAFKCMLCFIAYIAYNSGAQNVYLCIFLFYLHIISYTAYLFRIAGPSQLNDDL
jgi:hypothetical protein